MKIVEAVDDLLDSSDEQGDIFNLWKGLFLLNSIVDPNTWIKQPKCNKVL